MTVFKNYLKIVKQFIPTMLIYIVIFSVFAVLASSSNQESTDFAMTKPNIAIINNDSETVFINTILYYLDENSNIIEIENDINKIKDALYYNEINFFLEIPENFTRDFMKGNEPQIKTKKIPNSYSSIYMEMLLNRMLNISKVYAKAGMTEEQIQVSIKEDLTQESDVIMIDSNAPSKIRQISTFYNFTNYTFLALSVSIVAMVMHAFTSLKIKRRNYISSTSIKNINSQLFMGNFIVISLIWLIFAVIAFAMYGKDIFSTQGILFLINSFIFCITTLSIGFLLGITIRSKEAINGIINIVALGSSFLAGAFVPQELLGDFVLSIARVLPSYWFIVNNNIIADLSVMSFNNLQPIIFNIFILVGYTILFFVLTNVITKLRQKSI